MRYEVTIRYVVLRCGKRAEKVDVVTVLASHWVVALNLATDDVRSRGGTVTDVRVRDYPNG